MNRVLAESSLDELEILHPKFDFDLSHQLAVKRVAIDSSMIDSLPQLPHLDELVLKNIHEGDLPRLQRFHQVSRLTLTGDVVVVSQVNASTFNRLSSLEVHVSDHESSDQRRGVRFESSIQATAISFQTNATTTNDSLSSYVCDLYTPSVTKLSITCTTTTEWLQIPSCLSDWSTLTEITTTNCMLPDLTTLPVSITSISLAGYRGPIVTQADIGTDTGVNGGYFDWMWLNRLPDLYTLTMGTQSINGTLPNHLSHSALSYLALPSSQNNRGFAGTISPNFFLQYPNMTNLITTYNNISGTIPYYGLENVKELSLGSNLFTHWPPLIVNSTIGFGAPSKLSEINLFSNRMQQIPSESDFQSMMVMSLYLGGNSNLTSPMPNIFNTTTPRTSRTLVSLISASGSRLSGTLPEVPEYQNTLYTASSSSWSLLCSSCLLVGSFPASWQNTTLGMLDLQSIAGLNGSLATIDPSSGLIVSQFVKTVKYFYLGSTIIAGPMYNLTTAGTTQLSITAPMDFCASSRAKSANNSPVILYSGAPVTYCVFGPSTNASSCPTGYPSVCFPAVPNSPVAPVASPTPQPIAAPIETCPMPSPGPSFVCEGNTWVSHDSVTEQTITLPPASTTTINGNLTTTSIVITSASSSINVTGCVTTSDGKTPMITIVLTQSDLEELVKSGGKVTTEVVHQGPGCAAISSSSLNVDSSGIKSCKSVSTDKIGTGSGLAATFTVHTSKCNVWWIVLVSVLCGAVIIALVVTIIVWRLCKTSSMKRERNRLA